MKQREIEYALILPQNSFEAVKEELYIVLRKALYISSYNKKQEPIIVLEDNEMKLISKEEMIKRMSTDVKVELKYNFETNKGERRGFSGVNALFEEKIMSPQQIFNCFTEICNASKQFPIALASCFNNKRIAIIPGTAIKEFRLFTPFYEWSKQDSTLKRSSFISILNRFNQNYRDIVKRLNDSGVELPEFIKNCTGNVQNDIELPSQGEIITELKPWIVKNPKTINFYIDSILVRKPL